MPDETYGEAVCAWVELTSGMDTTTEALESDCKGNILSYRMPKHIRFVDECPLTASGEVQKFRMGENMNEKLGRG